LTDWTLTVDWLNGKDEQILPACNLARDIAERKCVICDRSMV
jgi:hypothetical protein